MTLRAFEFILLALSILLQVYKHTKSVEGKKKKKKTKQKTKLRNQPAFENLLILPYRKRVKSIYILTGSLMLKSVEFFVSLNIKPLSLELAIK